MRFETASVDSLILYFGDHISTEVAEDVRRAFYTLSSASLPFIIEVIPAYTSILISYDFTQLDEQQIIEEVKQLLHNKSQQDGIIESRSIEIPVCYDIEFGLDLEYLSKTKKLSTDEVINLHTNIDYFVYAIGFSPGFPYMGEVVEELMTPRLSNPRTKVPRGSVGIAERQTAIYPQLSPGGWNILGRTPIEMFNTDYDGFSYLRVGDKVTFKPISKKEFIELEARA